MPEDLLTETLPMEDVVTEPTQENLNQEVEPTEPQVEQAPTEESVDLSPIDKLINQRTSFFKIKLDVGDLKWIKNQVASGKIPYKGPNEAFMVMNAYMGFSSAALRKELEVKNKMETDGTVEMSAAAIEGAAILLNKYEGAGVESAQKVFRIAVALNDAIMHMKELDEAIAKLRKAEAESATQEG